jgi:hypothetical protein
MPFITSDQLLQQLENLKTDTQTKEAKFETLLDEDFTKASDIRDKIAELMAVNKTLISLSFRWTYLHKRQCRDIIVSTENQQIKVKLVNSDNTSGPGEFMVPGFSEVDGLDTDEQDNPILVKEVAVYDRSALTNTQSLSNPFPRLFNHPNDSSRNQTADATTQMEYKLL